MFPRNFELSQTFTSVSITVWKRGKCFLLLKDIMSCLYAVKIILRTFVVNSWISLGYFFDCRLLLCHVAACVHLPLIALSIEVFIVFLKPICLAHALTCVRVPPFHCHWSPGIFRQFNVHFLHVVTWYLKKSPIFRVICVRLGWVRKKDKQKKGLRV